MARGTAAPLLIPGGPLLAPPDLAFVTSTVGAEEALEGVRDRILSAIPAVLRADAEVLADTLAKACMHQYEALQYRHPHGEYASVDGHQWWRAAIEAARDQALPRHVDPADQERLLTQLRQAVSQGLRSSPPSNGQTVVATPCRSGRRRWACSTCAAHSSGC